MEYCQDDTNLTQGIRQRLILLNSLWIINPPLRFIPPTPQKYREWHDDAHAGQSQI